MFHYSQRFSFAWMWYNVVWLKITDTTVLPHPLSRSSHRLQLSSSSLTNSTGWNPSRDSNIPSASLEISCILWNPKIQLHCSHEPNICPYPEPNETCLHLPIPPFYIEADERCSLCTLMTSSRHLCSVVKPHVDHMVYHSNRQQCSY